MLNLLSFDSNSDSDSLTELSDTKKDSLTPNFTSSSAFSALAHYTTQNIERIDYYKAYTGRASLGMTNSFIPINSSHSTTYHAIGGYICSSKNIY